MKQIGGELPPPFFLHHDGMLKKKKCQQMRKAEGEQRSEEDLHDYVQIRKFVRFRTISEMNGRLATPPLQRLWTAANNTLVLDFGKQWKYRD
jgi:hypothetical protein